jgi:hydrogenase maturation protease
VSRVLVLGWGNPSRGDDALGPELVRRLEALAGERNGWHAHAFLTDFQLQPEHATDLLDCDLVLFADADLRCAAPYSFTRVQRARDPSFTTHAMSPAAVLAVYHQVFEREPPDAYVLGMRGEQFELGDAMSATALHHLDAALSLAARLLDAPELADQLLRGPRPG